MARKKRKQRKFDPSDLHPALQKGFTQGETAEEVAADIASQPSGVELIRHMRDTTTVPGTRVPLPKFVAEDDINSVWYEPEGDRLQRNVVFTFQPETIQAIKAGMICLRCLEPQRTAFGNDHLPGCTYPMEERQIMDFAMEFEGGKHLGPAKPISEYMQERELEQEKRKFNQRRRDGASPMKGLR